METQKSLDQFNEMPVRQAVLKNALPAMAAMLMVLIYNLADTFFIGQTHDPLQVAAVSLGTPVFLMFMSVGTVFGIGGTSVISRALGEGRKDYAKKVCSFCMWCCIVIGIVMAGAFLLFMDDLLRIIGASSDTWDYAKTYLTICTIGGPFALISSCFSNILRSEGQANKAMTGQILGNVLNMLLDAVLIMGFHLDILGCALATLIGEAVGAVYYLMFYLRGQSTLSISVQDFTVKERVASSTLAIGVPAALGSLLMSVSGILMNAQMVAYGDMAVAGIGVAMKVVMITGMICMGLGQGVQPLLGYCVGSRNWKRFKEILRYSLTFALILGTAMTVVCYLFNGQIVGAFLTEPDSAGYAGSFSKILLSTGALFGVFYVLSNALQAMGAAVSSLVINLSRQGLIYIPALFALQAAFGIYGLAWAQPASDVLSFLIAVVLYFVTLRKMARD